MAEQEAAEQKRLPMAFERAANIFGATMCANL